MNDWKRGKSIAVCGLDGKNYSAREYKNGDKTVLIDARLESLSTYETFQRYLNNDPNT